MIVIDPKNTMDTEDMYKTVKRASDYVKSAALAEHAKGIRAPGEGILQFHSDHDKNGIYVDDSVWEEICAL